MEIVKINGVGTHIVDTGPRHGPVLIFINSLGTDLRLWSKFTPFIPKHFRTIFYDKRGHGLSEVSPHRFDGRDLALDVMKLAEVKEIDNFCIMGVSIGGQIGLQAASDFPSHVGALVFSNSAPRIGDQKFWNDRIDFITKHGLLPAADGVLARWFSQRFRSDSPVELSGWRAMLTRTPVDGYLACCEVLKSTDLRPQASQLALETLVVAGSEDGSTPPETVKNGAKLFPDARFVTIEGSGHLPCIEKPREYAEVVFSYIENTDWYKRQ